MRSSLLARRFGRLLATSAAVSVLVIGVAPVVAQDSVDSRLSKVETEVRALQRKVFPGPDGKYFEPEITPARGASGPAAAPVAAPSASSPLGDVLTRMDTLEAQLARLTSQVEQNTNRINLIEAKLGMGEAAVPAAAPETAPAATLPAPATAPATVPAAPKTAATQPAGSAPAPTMAAPRPAATVPAGTPAVSTVGAATPTPKPAAPKPVVVAAPSAARVDAVKAIVKPQTDDAGDDEYSYGFRLWEAKFYPEAEQQLKLFIEKYPRHRRASWGRNLLGRAILEQGNPGEAAKWFLQNYQADKRGERAPDSLLYLAVTMKQMKDTRRACIALAEFGETYASEAAGRLKGLYDSTSNGLTCS